MYWNDDSFTFLQQAVAYDRFGLITDVDGTISPIVDQPSAAQVTERSRALLAELQTCLPLVAVISGRAAVDVQARVGITGLVYVGNHGLERWVDGQVQAVPEAAAYRPALEAALDTLHGHKAPKMFIEDKGVTLSVHYRQTANPAAIAVEYRPLVQDIATQNDLRLYEGRMVFELRPPIDVNKGWAFEQLIHDHNLQAAMYIGDDTTDVDAFNAARKQRASGTCFAFGIGVEADETPQAVVDASDALAYGVSGVESLLDWVLSARTASSTCA